MEEFITFCRKTNECKYSLFLFTTKSHLIWLFHARITKTLYSFNRNSSFHVANRIKTNSYNLEIHPMIWNDSKLYLQKIFINKKYVSIWSPSTHTRARAIAKNKKNKSYPNEKWCWKMPENKWKIKPTIAYYLLSIFWEKNGNVENQSKKKNWMSNEYTLPS